MVLRFFTLEFMNVLSIAYLSRSTVLPDQSNMLQGSQGVSQGVKIQHIQARPEYAFLRPRHPRIIFRFGLVQIVQFVVTYFHWTGHFRLCRRAWMLCFLICTHLHLFIHMLTGFLVVGSLVAFAGLCLLLLAQFFFDFVLLLS